MVSVGERIRFIRKRVLGLTQEGFSKLLGVSHDMVSAYERGVYEPSLGVLQQMAELGGCSVEWLLTGKGKAPPGCQEVLKPGEELIELLNLRTPGERVRYLREKLLSLSPSALAKKLGVKKADLDKYENNKLDIPYRALVKLADLVNVSIDFILTGRRTLRDEGVLPAAEERIKKLERELRELEQFLEREFKLRRRPRKEEVVTLDLKSLYPGIPVIAEIPAGHPVRITRDMVIDWVWVPEDSLIKKGKEVFGIKIEGDSMSPELRPGDYAIIIAQPTARNHDIVVARLNGEAVIKEFVKKGSQIILHSSNPAYKPIVVTSQDDFCIIGIVYGIGMRRLQRK